MSDWIAVDDMLPPSRTVVLLLNVSGVVFSGRERYGTLGEPSQDTFAYRAECCGRFGGVTHWMPLPEPLKEIKDD